MYCDGPNSCSGAIIDGIQADYLAIVSTDSESFSAPSQSLAWAIIKCPDDGAQGRGNCEISSTSTTAHQFYHTTIEAVEGFNDVQFTCDSSQPDCVNSMALKCGNNFQHDCMVQYTGSTSYTRCDPSGVVCERYQQTPTPSLSPTIPTLAPITASPTFDPTIDPTLEPTTSEPTNIPTVNPTKDPTTQPSYEPTNDPTLDPTNDPTTQPTYEPTTAEPTSMQPSDAPSKSPIMSLGMFLMIEYLFDSEWIYVQ